MEQTQKTRKQASEKKRKRRQELIRQIKLGAGLCLGLAVVLFLLCSFVFFKVDTIQVEGVEDEECGGSHKFTSSCYYSDEEIIRLCGVNEGESLVMLSKKDIEETLEKLLPYIGNAQVKRKYPSTLRIIVEDTHAKYAVDAGGGYTLMNEDFKVLSVSNKVPADCAKLIGVHVLSADEGSVVQFSDEAYKTRLASIEDCCEKSGLLPVTRIDISNIANVSFTVDKQYTVVLGMLTDLDAKFNAAVTAVNAEKEKDPDARRIITVTDPERAYVGDDKSPVEEEDSSDADSMADDDIPYAVG